MTKDEFLEQILEACSAYHWEFNGTYKHYEIASITSHVVSITVVSFGFDSGYADIIDFQNDEDLIDKMLEKL
jgi:hypothetical protein|tara:strand:+ start:468 stop:683 length:216 start_codon:yes stop_codon:yes gene_type:complete